MISRFHLTTGPPRVQASQHAHGKRTAHYSAARRHVRVRSAIKTLTFVRDAHRKADSLQNVLSLDVVLIRMFGPREHLTQLQRQRTTGVKMVGQFAMQFAELARCPQ